MSLQVWLPLINDIHNQGTSNCIPESSGISTNAAGKIGSCQYLSGAATSYINTNYSTNIGTNDFSIAMWLKLPTISSGSYFAICSSKTAAAASAGFGIYWNYSQKKFLWSTADDSAGAEIWMATAVDSIVYDKWIHLVMIRNSNDSKKGYFYINGTRYELTSVPAIKNITTDTKMYIGKCTNGSYPTKMYINDFRIYDHALSAAEVKEISQGLVLHYKLDKIPTTITNAYNMTSWNTNATRGGFSAWGPSGHSGTSGNNTDRNYIYRNDRTYSYYISEDAGTGKYFIFYQSPTFEGGYRSLSAIIKEQNGIPIDETVCVPSWNANVTGSNHAPLNIWTHKISLGNGFYLCQVDGFYQDGSNDLVSINVLPGYKIYISEIWLEDDKQISSDVLFPSEQVEDSSGYGHNGIITGNLTLSSNTPRHSASSIFNGTERITTTTPGADIRTLSCWCKTTKNKSTSQQMVADSFSNMTISFYNGTIIGVFGTTRGTGSKCTLGDSYKENDWNHIVVVKTDDAGARDIYCNGVKLTPTSNDYWSAATGFFVGARNTSNGNPFYGEISDVRAYCTALSVDDILQLYHTSAKADNLGGFHAFELSETNNGIELLAVPLTTSYGNHTNVYTEYDSNGEITLTGGSSIGSYYIPINPTGKTYYYDIEVSTDSGNAFYIGFQRYDANKTARSNDATVYLSGLSGSKEARVHAHYHGTVNLSTDGVNPCAFTSLRILNDWSGANGRHATIHKISLREVSTLQNTKINKYGQVITTELIEMNDKFRVQKNGIIEANEFLEL